MQFHKRLTNLGQMMILESCILLIPLMVLPFYTSESAIAWQFIVPAAGSFLLGAIIGRFNRVELHGSQLVVFAWLYGFFLASIPFYLHGGLSPVQALFESASGFTTTGLTLLTPEELPHILLFFRGLLQYVGGLGFVMMVLLFSQSKDSARMYQAEGHTDKLMASIGKTVKVIAMIYGGFLFLGTVLYTIFGMPLFDSIVHSMCALSTAGFSNHADSIGAYNSLPIDCISVFLMLVGLTSFYSLLLLIRGRLKSFLRSSELRFLGGMMLILVPIITFFLVQDGEPIGESAGRAFFHAVSAVSTTGYSTCSLSDWPEEALGVMLIFMLIGGGIGSTAGGIKLGRACRLSKNMVWSIKKKLLTDRTVKHIYYYHGPDKEIITRDQIEQDYTFAHVFILIYFAGTIALTYFSDCSLLEGAFEFASSLGTVGISIGITNMDTPAICLIIEIIGMALGRLEIFVLLQAFLTRR